MIKHIKEVLTQDGYTLCTFGSTCYLEKIVANHHVSIWLYAGHMNYWVRTGNKFYRDVCTSSSYEDFDVVYPEFKRKCDIILTTALFRTS